MVKFYKHDIADWMDGTESLSHGAYRLYHVICQLIYLQEGQITLNERGLAGRANMRPQDVKTYLKQLQDAGKVTSFDGHLGVNRCSFELHSILIRRSSIGQGVSKSLKNKGATQVQPPLEKSREEKTRLDNKESKTLVQNKDLNADSFNQFWKAYPRKQGKGKARGVFGRKVFNETSGIGVPLPTLLDGVEKLCQYVAESDPKFTPMPTTWLNREGWLDQYPAKLKHWTEGIHDGIVDGYESRCGERGRSIEDNSDDNEVLPSEPE